MQKTRSFGIKMAGPISIDIPGTLSTKSEAGGTDPALTHLFELTRYLSALGWLFTSAHKIELLGRSVQLSSELLSSLLPPGDHVLVMGSKIAVRVELMSPKSTLPSGSTQSGASPILFQAGGAGTAVQESAAGS